MANTTTQTAIFAPFKVYTLTDNAKDRLPPAHKLIAVRWKEKKEAKTDKVIPARPSVCVAVPAQSVDVMPAILQAAMNKALHDLTASAVSTWINSEIQASTFVSITTLTVPESLLTYEGLAAYSAAEAASSRLTTEKVNAWFDASLKVEIELALVAKLGEERATAALMLKLTTDFREAFARLASPNGMLPKAEVEKLLNVLAAKAPASQEKDILIAKCEAKLLQFQIVKEGLIDLEF